jgi:hypothetical protein
MSNPVMYPTSDNPDARVEFETFADLRNAVESKDEELNAIVSWHSFTPDATEDFPEYEPHDAPELIVLIYMPRKNRTTQFETDSFDPIEFEVWIEEYVRPRVMRWYGWAAA